MCNTPIMKPCDDYEQGEDLIHECFNCGHTEQEHYPDVTPRECVTCSGPIPLARLEVLPKTIHCTKCVDKHGPKKVWDPNEICSRASQSSQNGFAGKD